MWFLSKLNSLIAQVSNTPAPLASSTSNVSLPAVTTAPAPSLTPSVSSSTLPSYLPVPEATGSVNIPLTNTTPTPDISIPQLPVPAGTEGAVNPDIINQAAQASHHLSVFQVSLLIIYFLVCAAMIALVLIQTSKSEGLTGTLGGTTKSVFQGKRSFDDKLTLITTYVAIAFIVLSILVSLFAF